MLDRTKAPQIYPYPRLVMPQPERITTSDGTVIRNLNLGELPVNRLTLSWRYGQISSINQVALSTLSQIIAEGAAGKSGAAISELLDYNGAWFKPEMSINGISLTFHSLNKSFRELLPTFLDIACRPDFPEHELRMVCERMASQARINQKRVAFVVADASRRHLFGENHPLSKRPNPDLFLELTREDIVDTFSKTLLAAKPNVYIAGATTDLITDLKSSIESNFKGLPIYQGREIIPLSPTPGRYYIEVEGANQSAVNISIPTINRSHPDYINLRLAVIALGGYFGSRLMSNIREDKGYTYGIYSALMGYSEGGAMSISAQTAPEYVEPLIEEVFNEITRLANEPMSADEFEPFKSHCMSTLASELDGPFSIIEHHITCENMGIADGYYERQLDAITHLTPATICDVMSRHIDVSQAIIDVAGPAK